MNAEEAALWRAEGVIKFDWSEDLTMGKYDKGKVTMRREDDGWTFVVADLISTPVAHLDRQYVQGSGRDYDPGIHAWYLYMLTVDDEVRWEPVASFNPNEGARHREIIADAAEAKQRALDLVVERFGK